MIIFNSRTHFEFLEIGKMNTLIEISKVKNYKNCNKKF